MKHLTTLAFLLILLPGIQVFANSPEIYSHKRHGAIKGVDPVAYFSLPEGADAVKGNKEINYEWKGATWYFSSEQNKKKFIANPEKYVPEYGGYCAFAVAHGFVTSPRPNNWKIVNGKLYLNNNRTSYNKWLDDYKNKISKADENWPEVLKD